MLNVVIIDDEIKSIKSLTWELETFCQGVKIERTFTNPREAINFLKKSQIDCIFLDIEMPEMDGFQFLAEFPHRQFDIIFVTAYDQYAIKAIKEQALDYLLKPIDSDELIKTIAMVEEHKKERLSQQMAVENLQQSNKSSEKRIAIPVDGKLIFLLPEEIIYCESDGNYTKIHLEKGRPLLVTKILKELHTLLPENPFCRIHNQYIINIDKVKEYIKSDAYVKLNNGKSIPVSRSKRLAFLDMMK